MQSEVCLELLPVASLFLKVFCDCSRDRNLCNFRAYTTFFLYIALPFTYCSACGIISIRDILMYFLVRQEKKLVAEIKRTAKTGNEVGLKCQHRTLN